MPLGLCKVSLHIVLEKSFLFQAYVKYLHLTARETGRASTWHFHFYKTSVSSKTHLFHLGLCLFRHCQSLKLKVKIFLVRCYVSIRCSLACMGHTLGMTGSKEPCIPNKVTAGNGQLHDEMRTVVTNNISHYSRDLCA